MFALIIDCRGTNFMVASEIAISHVLGLKQQFCCIQWHAPMNVAAFKSIYRDMRSCPWLMTPIRCMDMLLSWWAWVVGCEVDSRNCFSDVEVQLMQCFWVCWWKGASRRAVLSCICCAVGTQLPCSCNSFAFSLPHTSAFVSVANTRMLLRTVSPELDSLFRNNRRVLSQSRCFVLVCATARDAYTHLHTCPGCAETRRAALRKSGAVIGRVICFFPTWFAHVTSAALFCFGGP